MVFPKPVYWIMDRKPDQPFMSSDPKYGTVYRVSNAQEVWEMVQREGGYVYQTHPRTKGRLDILTRFATRRTFAIRDTSDRDGKRCRRIYLRRG